MQVTTKTDPLSLLRGALYDGDWSGFARALLKRWDEVVGVAPVARRYLQEHGAVLCTGDRDDRPWLVDLYVREDRTWRRAGVVRRLKAHNATLSRRYVFRGAAAEPIEEALGIPYRRHARDGMTEGELQGRELQSATHQLGWPEGEPPYELPHGYTVGASADGSRGEVRVAGHRVAIFLPLPPGRRDRIEYLPVIFGRPSKPSWGQQGAIERILSAVPRILVDGADPDEIIPLHNPADDESDAPEGAFAFADLSEFDPTDYDEAGAAGREVTQ